GAESVSRRREEKERKRKGREREEKKGDLEWNFVYVPLTLIRGKFLVFILCFLHNFLYILFWVLNPNIVKLL
ncbi:hypothetical protein P3S20_24600, partial [Enterobacter hormaechei]|uniref:hypothetical protein n=1 Tax=Enterobacter hormaechei TaxID=158836 RepID=UPI0023E45FBD